MGGEDISDLVHSQLYFPLFRRYTVFFFQPGQNDFHEYSTQPNGTCSQFFVSVQFSLLPLDLGIK